MQRCAHTAFAPASGCGALARASLLRASAPRGICARRPAAMAVGGKGTLDDCGAGMRRLRAAESAAVAALGAAAWPVWTAEAQELPWRYDEDEVCWLLEGDVVVVASSGEEMRVRGGDVAYFPAGMECVWKISEAVKKHYSFGTDLAVLEK